MHRNHKKGYVKLEIEKRVENTLSTRALGIIIDSK